MISAPTDSPVVGKQMLLACILCMAFGPSMFLLMPIYVGQLQHAMALSEAHLGLLASSDLIGIAIASATAPFWINRAPWRLLAGLGLTGLVACNLMAITITEFAPLMTLRLFAGLLTGIVASITMGVYSHSVDPDRVAAILVFCQVFYQSLAFLVLPGFVASAGLAGLLIPVAVLQSLALASTFFFPRRPIITPRAVSASVEGGTGLNWPALFILTAMGVFFIGQSSLWAFIELVGNGFGLNDAEVGYALAVSTFVALAGPAWCAWAGDRHGRLLPILAGGMGQIIILTFMDAATSVWIYAGMLSVFQVFWTLGLSYQFSAMVSADHSNRFVVILPASQCIGIAIGPILGGAALEQFGNAGLYLVSGSALAVYLLLIVPFLRRPVAL